MLSMTEILMVMLVCCGLVAVPAALMGSQDPLGPAIKVLDEQANLLTQDYPDATYFALTPLNDKQEVDKNHQQDALAPRQTLLTVKNLNEAEETLPNVRLTIGNSITDYKSVDLTFPQGVNVQLIRDETHDKGEYTFRVWKKDKEPVNSVQFRKNAPVQ